MESRKQQASIIRFIARTRMVRGAVVAAALILGITAIGSAQAQSTVAMIHGKAPAGATVVARSNSGMHRQTTVKDNGRYVLRSLPLGIYTVTLKKNGKTSGVPAHVPLTVGRGFEVDFDCPHNHCAAPQDGHSSS